MRAEDFKGDLAKELEQELLLTIFDEARPGSLRETLQKLSRSPIERFFSDRRGVCQDLAHLQIACLRSLGLAARYVSGYLQTIPPANQERLLGADASHAWVSIYCPRVGWIDADATNDLIPSTSHITLAWGRDYSDASPIRGVIQGGGQHQLTVSVDVVPIDEDENLSWRNSTSA